MNFVLHLHLAVRELGSPAAGAGAMLPDLWRIADRRVRARSEVKNAAGELTDVLAGIAHHLEVDRWFHADAAFVDGEREAALLLGEARLSASRSVLFAHVLWELCLDGALLRRDRVDEVLDRLRRAIAALGPAAALRAADLHHFDRVARTADDRAAFAARLDRILTEVARGPWVAGYETGAGIAARLQGVRRGVGLEPMDERDLVALASVAEALLARAAGSLERIEGSTRTRRSP